LPGACPGRPGSAEADQLADIDVVDDVGDEPGRVAGDPARGCGARGRGPEAEIVEAAGHGLGGVGLADGDAGVDGVLDPTAFTECDGNASTRVEDVAGGDGVGHLVGGLEGGMGAGCCGPSCARPVDRVGAGVAKYVVGDRGSGLAADDLPDAFPGTDELKSFGMKVVEYGHQRAGAADCGPEGDLAAGGGGAVAHDLLVEVVLCAE